MRNEQALGACGFEDFLPARMSPRKAGRGSELTLLPAESDDLFRDAKWKRRKTQAIIYAMSLGLTRGYKHHLPRPQPVCPSFSSTAVFLLLHKPPALSHKKCNEQSGWKRLGMEQAVGHASLKSLRGHRLAAA